MNILSEFNEQGLLVRTVMLKNLAKDFLNINDSIEYAKSKYTELPMESYYGPKRRWTIAHKNIKPIFFNMGRRHLAIMAGPRVVDWSKYLKIDEQDASSNYRITETECLDASKAEELYNNTVEELKVNSWCKTVNNEVSTCGFDIKALCGLLTDDKNYIEENKEKILGGLSGLRTEYKVNNIEVFTYGYNEYDKIAYIEEYCTLNL